MRSSLSLCPLWALWVQETRFWGSWQNSDFGTFRNPAKIRASESDHDSNADESCPWVSDPQEFHFPFYSDRLSNCFRVSDFIDFLGFPGGSAVINLLAEQEIWVPSLIWEDPLEKEMATHSSVLAWRIPGNVEPDGLPSMGSHRVGHDWSDLAAAAAAYIPRIHNKLSAWDLILKSRSLYST